MTAMRPPDWDNIDTIPPDTSCEWVLAELLMRLRVLTRVSGSAELLQEMDSKEFLDRHLSETINYIKDIDIFADKARKFLRESGENSV